ncbi:hypothetical protein FE257_004347 [Aspergillus nanangensis]|uniref:ubiquitinyl hydrolase 1 n=1 Tax=Aspergillus nanangensis TaxID=2582783 RepID=A0AAD4CC03_ASPNN|nr:hypothetical protein FE257_004347 [Aspergillus nanangensis]
MDSENEILAKVFSHIALPPKLPGRRERDDEALAVDHDMILRMLQALAILQEDEEEGPRSAWGVVEKSLRLCNFLNSTGYVNKAAFRKSLQQLTVDNPIILHVAQQNACLIIRNPRDHVDVVTFEAFEASPQAEPTLAAAGALECDFPGLAVSLPVHEFDDPIFQDSLCSFIEKASLEAIDEFSAKRTKAGVEVSERRDTTDPAIITRFLMTLLEVNGRRECPPVLRKRVKDDVCWDHAELPWRRQPLWLVLRVCVRWLLTQSLDETVGRMQYKCFMCLIMARLLMDGAARLEPEKCDFLKKKLCRRLVKLEMEKDRCSGSVRDAYSKGLALVGKTCQPALDHASQVARTRWDTFKSQTQRTIPLLPGRADEGDLRLTLPNSAAYFRGLSHPLDRAGFHVGDGLALQKAVERTNTGQFSCFTRRYVTLAQLETCFEAETPIPTKQAQCERLCMDLARQMEQYMAVAADAYDGDPEQMSIGILNLMDLWVHMDQCATVVYPLLLDYRPWIRAESLDVLLLSERRHLQRLQKVQLYLVDREERAQADATTIFAGPSPGSFADRFFTLPAAANLRALEQRIADASEVARAAKEKELDKVNAQYQSLTEQMAMSACTQRQNPDGTHKIQGCTHCYHVRCRRRLRIEVHEDFLPSLSAERRTVIFELDPPRTFAVYRSVTWNLIARFCLPTRPQEQEPMVLLRAYSPLSDFDVPKSDHLTLASKAKSFLGTHYKSYKLPIKPGKILLSLPLRFEYYDSQRGIWLRDGPPSPNFSHLFANYFVDHFQPLGKEIAVAFASGLGGPSSYEVVASSSECPAGVSLQEFTAQQALMGGITRRWLAMLVEFSSSNLNFGLQSTMVLFRFLALQTGPRRDDDELRAIHCIFRDESFCRQLANQVHHHLRIITANWRETSYMETLLTVAVRLCTLGCAVALPSSLKLLGDIRHATLTWVRMLRSEARRAREVDAAERAARYCFLSAILCRRTFVLLGHEDHQLDSSGFQAFVEATLALQESLMVDMDHFSDITRSMLVRDIKMSYALRQPLLDMVGEHPSALGDAINAVWPGSTGSRRVYDGWHFLSHPHDDWVTSTVESDSDSPRQTVHYHLLEGHLLVDGHAMGKLPSDLRDSAILKELFGNQRLVAFPSNKPGLNYILAADQEGYEIHLGYRRQGLVVRAFRDQQVLELVPRNVFGTGTTLDLPGPLIGDCVHWLDVHTGTLEIRKHPHIWKGSSWVVDVGQRRAARRRATLVDPHGGLAQMIAHIFRDFEDTHMLTITQPTTGPLTVELKRMDLTFHVNRKGFLQCRQLAAEVDPNQDAGTFYGLQSMLVLRNAFDRSQRSIITTIGKASYRRHDMHVLVQLQNTGSYAQYKIDAVLGRLRSASEPRLLYNKIQLHALTSSFVPDPLTGRTGAEEALRGLRAADSQPWSSLSPACHDILSAIAALAPRREYYPADRKVQQTVVWDPQLTVAIQHDAYPLAVEPILIQSEQLALFHAQLPGAVTTPRSTVSFLCQRAILRRSLHERVDTPLRDPDPCPDTPYIARDRWSHCQRRIHVREIVYRLRSRVAHLPLTLDLHQMLRKWPVIGGFGSPFVVNLLGDALDLDLSGVWGKLVQLSRTCRAQDMYHLMFQLGLIAFGKMVNMETVRLLAVFFIIKELQSVPMPDYASFAGYEKAQEPQADDLSQMARLSCQPFPESRASRRNPTARAGTRRRVLTREEHELACSVECDNFATRLMSQWPCEEPSVDGLDLRFLDPARALEAIRPEWSRLYKNFRLSECLETCDNILARYRRAEVAIPPPRALGDSGTLWRGPPLSRIIPILGEDLVDQSALPHGLELPSSSRPNGLAKCPFDEPRVEGQSLCKTPEVEELETIVASLVGSRCPVKSQYGHDLKQSAAALKAKEDCVVRRVSPHVEFAEGVRWLNGELRRAQGVVDHCRDFVARSLSRGDPRHPWLHQSDLWPCTAPFPLLQQLNTSRRCRYGPGMKNALISLGMAITRLQQLIRMKEALAKNDTERLAQEHRNSGHQNWSPVEFQDWLLLEIDSDVMIREVQVTVAREMIAPRSGSNSVLQMNMGQGKTSMIMPMIAVALAGGSLLTRVFVPKALLAQTAQVFRSRLGGILDRAVTHIPFSRRTPTTPDMIGVFQKLHENMRRGSGIILGIPEHALSFKLTGLQRLSDGRLSEAADMMQVEEWLGTVCRDILDECDYTLAVRTQLVFPNGSQMTVDGHPGRWELTLQLLGQVSHHARGLGRELPQSIQVVERAESAFPILHFLRPDAEEALVDRIVREICHGPASMLALEECSPLQRDAVQSFLSHQHVDPAVVATVLSVSERVEVQKGLYLLRGLLAHGILLLCLKKRWNVRYGLHPGRDPMAVPFYGKGVPSDQAEWGQPDVAILFTCLAFYHEGLTAPQFRQSLDMVLRSDDPAPEYDRWTQSAASLPEPLRHWNIVNVDDAGQMAELWRCLRFTTATINHYLTRWVFPIHAKQFGTKMQASAWDLPLDPPAASPAMQAPHPGLTTGFSGTNDNRRLLPLSIQQEDLPGLAHTNAEVLTYLLQRRNRQYVRVVPQAPQAGAYISVMDVLRTIKQQRTRLLIDAGALILEMGNQAFAKTWLQVDDDATAAVYFGSDDQPWVQYRTGKTIPLVASPFVDNLEKCLVYLDEAHTRGTDLKLPPLARGAVTLGLQQTKDHTVQAAMRLRQLGSTQSIVFLAPPEVHQSILDSRSLPADDGLDSSDVVRWLIDQTCLNNQELLPLHYAQGLDFCHRKQAAITYHDAWSNSRHRDSLLAVVQQPEKVALEQIYHAHPREEVPSFASGPLALPSDKRLRAFTQHILRNRDNIHNTSHSLIGTALDEVEQEREMAYEVEEQREIERPDRFRALAFPGLHPAIRAWIESGEFDPSAFVLASVMLQSTQLAARQRLDLSSLLRRLYVSPEFMRTVEVDGGQDYDSFTRPVHWVLFSTLSDSFLVVVPEEAEMLISLIRERPPPNIHLMTYVAAVTKRMLSSDSLNFYLLPRVSANWSPPSWLSLELGFLAGRLYFQYNEYRDILDCLGHTNGTDNPRDRRAPSLAPSAATSPLGFLLEWLAIRRQGQDVSNTPMGYVCRGWDLHAEHAFFQTATPGAPENTLVFPLDSCLKNDEYYESEDDDHILGVESDGGSEDDV